MVESEVTGVSITTRREYIVDFFDDAQQRAIYLLDLHASGRRVEALTLCLIYIDSFSQWLFWPRSKTSQNFVEALVEHGGDPEFALIHPLALTRAFDTMKGHWNDFAARLRGLFRGPGHSLYAERDFLAKISAHFTCSETKLIQTELWRGTIASVTYTRLRNPSIRSFRRAAEISFDNTTHQGQLARPITFQRLHQSLLNVIAEGRTRSIATNQWFGNDRSSVDA